MLQSELLSVREGQVRVGVGRRGLLGDDDAAVVRGGDLDPGGGDLQLLRALRRRRPQRFPVRGRVRPFRPHALPLRGEGL